MIVAFYGLCAVLALAGLWLTDPRTVPPISGTCALILTIAALGVALYR